MIQNLLGFSGLATSCAQVTPVFATVLRPLPEPFFARERPDGVGVGSTQIDTNAARIRGYI